MTTANSGSSMLSRVTAERAVITAIIGSVLVWSGCIDAEHRSASRPEKPMAVVATNETKTVTIAAASDLKFALDEFIVRFEAAHPDIRVTATYGSSGTLQTQILNHAPFDVYLSADAAYVDQLTARGLTLAGAEFSYAVGRLVVWSRNDVADRVERNGLPGLLDAAVRKVAIANPRHAPYGRAAVAALKSAGVYDALDSKLVLGENVAQAAQFVDSESADAALIALSLTRASAMRDAGRHWLVPADLHPPIAQRGVVLKRATSTEAARAFREAWTGEMGRNLLVQHGFELPPLGAAKSDTVSTRPDDQ